MPRNEFKDEGAKYHCPRCNLGMHHLCNDPECACEHLIADQVIPAGKPEDEVTDLDITIVDGGTGPTTLAELRRAHQSVTEAHRKTGHI